MPFDLILKKGRIVDGAGNPWYRGDIAIGKGKIAAISRSIGKKAERVIDLGGLTIAPGFIDTHSHTDRSIYWNKYGESALKQGITTMATGMCGGSAAPTTEELAERMMERLPERRIGWRTFKDFLRKVSENGLGINIAPFVGHNTIRTIVLGPEGKGGERTEVTRRELRKMKAYVNEAIKAGAFGLSTGLIYAPGRNATTEEIMDLCEVVTKYRGLYFTHIRNEGDTLLAAVAEAAEIGRKAGIPVHIAHFKASGRANWGKIVPALAIVEEARRSGVDITIDQYPYHRSQVGSLLSRLRLPGDPSEPEKLLEELRDEEKWAKRREKVLGNFREAERTNEERRRSLKAAGVAWPYYTGMKNTVIVYSKSHPEYVDKTVVEVAEERGVELVDAIRDLVVEDEGTTRTAGHMCEDDVRTALKHPLVMVGTDSSSIDGLPESPYATTHPRSLGSYPRILGKYVREERLLPLEEAIRKMTSYPAQRLRLGDRGLLRPGFWADIVVFDPETVNEVATFADPNHYPVGIEYVLVNGVVALEKGELTKALAGKVLKRGK
ncbi:MAG: amidohydrolase family protein [Candidatus Bathyarchaeia archaeon]